MIFEIKYSINLKGNCQTTIQQLDCSVLSFFGVGTHEEDLLYKQIGKIFQLVQFVNINFEFEIH